MAEEESFKSSLDIYSKQIESKINTFISFRNTLSSIESYDHFLNEKSTLIQLLFETEDILRSSCLFLRKNYFKLKQSLMMESINKEYDMGNNTISNRLYADPLTFKATNDNDTLQKEEEEKTIQKTIDKNALDTISYHLTTEKDNETLNVVDNDYHNQLKQKQSEELHQMHINKDFFDEVVKYQNEEEEEGLITGKLSSAREYEDTVKKAYQKKLNVKGMTSINDDHIISHSCNNPCAVKNNHGSKGIPLPKKSMIQQRKNLSMAEPSSMTQIPLYKDMTLKDTEKHPQLYDIDYDAIIQNPDCLIDSFSNKKNASLVADIIMKINCNSDLFQMILTLFNDNIINDLMEVPPNENLIETVAKSIKEIERLQAEDKIKEEGKVKKVQQQEIIDKQPINLSYMNFKNKPPHAYNSSTFSNGNSTLHSNLRKNKRNHTPSLLLMNNHHSFKGINSNEMTKTMTKKTTYADDLLANNGFTIKQKKKDQDKKKFSKVSNSMTNGELSLLSMTMKNMLPLPMYTSLPNHSDSFGNSLSPTMNKNKGNRNTIPTNKKYKSVHQSAGSTSLKKSGTYKRIKDTRFRSICS